MLQNMKDTKDGFIRDPNNPGAAINTDNDALLAYKRQKSKAKRALDAEKEINQLKSDVAEIKHMFSQLLEKLSK